MIRDANLSEFLPDHFFRVWGLTVLRYKHRVLCYILSHINSVTLNDTRIALLRALGTVSDSAKANILLPTIRALFTTHQPVNGDSPPSQELVGLLVSCYDTSVVNDFNDTQSNMWDVFMVVLRKLFTSKILYNIVL